MCRVRILVKGYDIRCDSFAAFSFLLALEFFILQAPDVAIAEAAIGAGLSTAILLIAIKGTKRTEGDE
jgi:Predicted subunit of the Multisubunit Na+/H+ antiporter